MESLTLKWSVTEKFHNYLYRTNLEALTDNNPLTYVFNTAKLDATAHKWLPKLFNYNFTIKYRSGKKNADAEGLSRLHENAETTTVFPFPDVLKAICQTVAVEKDEEPLVDSLEAPETANQYSQRGRHGTRRILTYLQDWQKAQTTDANINFVTDTIIEGTCPTLQQEKSKHVDITYLSDWDRYSVKDGVLHKAEVINGEVFKRVVLQGRGYKWWSVQKSSSSKVLERSCVQVVSRRLRPPKASLIKQRFFWPGMNQYIKERVQSCRRGIRRNSTPSKSAHLVNITSTAPMELVCIDYLSLERSKGGFENIQVIMLHTNNACSPCIDQCTCHLDRDQ